MKNDSGISGEHNLSPATESLSPYFEGLSPASQGLSPEELEDLSLKFSESRDNGDNSSIPAE